jgi:hypothetical protein
MSWKPVGIVLLVFFAISLLAGCSAPIEQAELSPLKVSDKPFCGEIVKTVYAEPEPEPEYYYEYSGYYSGYSNDFKSEGVRYGEDGTRYTWYSQNILPGGGLTELNNNGRHVDDQGFIRDADGYIAVASNDHAQGEIVDTPWGQGKVYDSGCASGTIDIYTDF